LIFMRRVLVVSSTYVDPANRGKLRALAARDLDVTVGVPQRWREAGLGRTLEVGWERQSGVEVFPIPVSGSGKVDRLRYAGRSLGTRSTRASRSGTWGAWCPRRESILCWRRWRRSAATAGI